MAKAFDFAPEKNAPASRMVTRAGALSTRLDSVIPCRAAFPQSRLRFTEQNQDRAEGLWMQGGTDQKRIGQEKAFMQEL